MFGSSSQKGATWKRGEVTFKWHGSRTINVFYRGREVDVISFGYNADDTPPTKEQAYQQVKEYDLERAVEADANM